MKQRVRSAIVFAVVAVVALLINVFFGYALSLLAAAVIFLCLFELYRCVEIPVKGFFFLYAEVFGVLTVLLFLPGYTVKSWMFQVQICLTAVYFAVTTVNGLFSRDGFKKTLRLGITTVLIVLAICVCTYWASECTVYREDGSTTVAVDMLLTTLLAPFASDIAGLLVGSAVGKHKMAPTISPKKTWEGFVGSVVGSPLILMLLGFGSDTLCRLCGIAVRANFLSLALTGLIGALFGTSGDLFFSLIKRKKGIKDYGNIMPGHGGMLDRFDSVVFTAIPITVLYMLLPQFAVI